MRTFSLLSYDEAQAYREAYVAALPELVERLRRRAERTGGPVLDGGVDSVQPLGGWFFEQLAADAEDGLSEYPMWWQPGAENSKGFFGEPAPSLRQVRLIDEVAAYLAHVVQASVPEAQWTIYRRDPKYRDIKQHRTVLEGPFGVIDPVAVVYKQAIGPISSGQTPDLGILHRWASSKINLIGDGDGG
ncbi:hypothetical protein CLV92_108137 [Kineococcus xinjiangensis]|uniref:Uncharacterized protein n=1 Tax=Kineococcus xinjiangensis TaxID=512762 RepID=A0A2S6IJ73_9ACTN|nr:hypothetical protein [Kineococcus xinjiangensis]PPK94235.1 hypothetical protein CLV92_108137 [Kineococcus xinjiangensis]